VKGHKERGRNEQTKPRRTQGGKPENTDEKKQGDERTEERNKR